MGGHGLDQGKNPAPNDLILGHSHHVWAMEPIGWQPVKQSGFAIGKKEASFEGVRYHLDITLTLDSTKEMFLTPLKHLEKDYCHLSRSQSIWRFYSQANM